MNLTIPRKLGVLIAVAVLTTTAAIAGQLLSLRSQIWNEREHLLASQVDVVMTMIGSISDEVDKGAINKEEGQRRAADSLRSMRFGSGNYFFVVSEKGQMLVHPKPKVEGSQNWDNQDSDGVYMTRKQIAAAQAGGGFTEYRSSRLGEEQPVPKLSYSALFKPWGWVVSTGVYVDDVEAQFQAALYKSLLWLGGILLVLIGCAWPLARSISRPIKAMTGAMRRLAAGEKSVEVPARGRRDEIGAMAEAVETFKDQAVERDRLAGEAEAARAGQDEAKQRQAALDNAKGEDLRAFVGMVETGFDRLSAGDLTVRMTGAVAPEFEPIRAKFNSSVAALEGAIGQVLSSVGSIRTGLSEITVASNDLAQRTEQQAASLEETVAALGEVTSAVNQTADGAGHAQTVATSARRKAEKGGAIVAEAVEAMSQIEASSQQINQIIGVIDEIAFQTNLLALNAGVEAARAGEAGKGFAVVAQEVRALAQRSAEAAKEIKGLIQTSSEQVSAGVDLVTASGKSLEEIVAEVSSMTDVIGRIADSAREQATSLREVSGAADQMDKVTQQNAAMVEESTAAAQTLAKETEELAGVMAQFKTAAEASATASGRMPAGRPTARSASRSASARGTSGSVPQLRATGAGGAARKAEAADDNWEEF
ncbi:methyl-accepting chemotaxis protein [Jiella sonneratiae]|uniref:Cache domain-containing protein n=1 Tax=Jiella sonneratiae TaxID=2816856 RepID=A0ABS3JAB1_9HYPH|nr:methyl-accepting chemotaxis protein [Jiella sonneratiae]MBO0906070.1 cache domain-containing protein [Jiella sonneratiae]